MPDEETESLKTMIREFRASVSEAFTAVHEDLASVHEDLASVHEALTGTQRQMSDLAMEVRTRISTTETAMLNSIRDLGQHFDRRVSLLERKQP